MIYAEQPHTVPGMGDERCQLAAWQIGILFKLKELQYLDKRSLDILIMWIA